MATKKNNPKPKSDTGDDENGEAELAFALRDTHDEVPAASVDPSAQDVADLKLDVASVEAMSNWADDLTREEKDQDDDPEFHEAVIRFETDKAERELAKEAQLETEAPSGKKVWDAAQAVELLKGTTTKLHEDAGTITAAEKDRWDALAGTLKTHQEVFSFQVAILFFVHKREHDRATRNVERLEKIGATAFLTKNRGWMKSITGHVLKTFKGAPTKSAIFPDQPGFVPQTLKNLDRDELMLRIHQLTFVSGAATCQTCCKPVGVDRHGDPFTACKDCREDERKASEMFILNQKLAEKNKLLAPLEELLTELAAAACYWVGDEEGKGRAKAQVAFDNAFGSTIAWHTNKVTEMKVSIVTGKITDADRAAVEVEKGFLLKVIDEVRTFRHLTYCPTCGTPTYPKASDHGNKPCDGCRNGAKQAAAHPVGDDVEDLEEVARDIGIGLVLKGRQPVLAEDVAPAFDPTGRFTDAWERRKKGKEKETAKGKGKKK